MRILLLAEFSAYGGTRTYFKQLISLYAEKNADVYVLSVYQDEEIVSLCEKHGFKFLKLSDIIGEIDFYGNGPLYQVWFERKKMRSFIADLNADLAVASVGTPGLFAGALSVSKKGLYILHTYPLRSSNKIRCVEATLVYSYLMKLGSFKIVTVSNFSKNQIIKCWGIEKYKDKVIVVYNCANDITERFQRQKTFKQINILTVGHVVEYKNPDNWLKMAVHIIKKSPQLNLRFVWVGDGELLELYREKVKALKFESCIKFIGYDPDIQKYYKESDIYVQPSRLESFGISVLDAMNHGLPCVVSNQGGLPEVVSDGQTGWVVDSENYIEFANKVEILSKDKLIRKNFGKNGRLRFISNFSEESWGRDIWNLH